MSEASAAALRRAFDASFAQRPAESQPSIDLLEIRVGAEPLLARVSDAASVQLAGRIVRMPGTSAELLGLAAIRSRVVPVFDLGALLGRAPRSGARWLALVGSPVIALAFAGVERQERVPETSLVAATTDQRFVSAVVSLHGATRVILDLRAVWEHVRERAERREGGGG